MKKHNYETVASMDVKTILNQWQNKYPDLVVPPDAVHLFTRLILRGYEAGFTEAQEQLGATLCSAPKPPT